MCEGAVGHPFTYLQSIQIVFQDLNIKSIEIIRSNKFAKREKNFTLEHSDAHRCRSDLLSVSLLEIVDFVR